MPFQTRELMVQLLAQYETDARNCGQITCLFGTVSPAPAPDCCGPLTNINCGQSIHATPCRTNSVGAAADAGVCFTKVHELLGAMALAEIQQDMINQKDATANLALSAIARLSGA